MAVGTRAKKKEGRAEAPEGRKGDDWKPLVCQRSSLAGPVTPYSVPGQSLPKATSAEPQGHPRKMVNINPEGNLTCHQKRDRSTISHT